MVDPLGGIAPGFLGGGNEGDVTSTSFEKETRRGNLIPVRQSD